MSTRYSTSLLVLCLATAAAGLFSAAAAQQWVMPRTPDGHPDLQGNWTNGTITPFQREEGRGPVFTLEEVARLEGRAEDRVVSGAEPSDPDRPLPSAGGDIGSYNDVYFERGVRVAVINGEPRSSLLTNPRAGGDIGSYNDVYFERGVRVAVINGEPRSSLLTNPPNGRRPPLTPEAQRQQQERTEFRSQFGDADHPENLSLTVRCLMFGSNVGPPMVPNGAYNNNYTIVQTADYVVIHAEVVHDTRIIRIGDGPRLPDHVRPWMGDSRGRWEGDALVVETTNIYPLHTFRGIRPTKNLKVFERFTRVDQETILYEFTIDDPTTYTEPWGGEIPMKALHGQLYEYACHEGNYSLAGILSGARYQERQSEQNGPE